MSEVTRILHAIEQGEPRASEQLLPLVYDELRRLAAAKLARENPGQTLEPTALLHEAYLRLVQNNADTAWDGRAHFFAAAAEAMRRILVDNARHKASLKCGGKQVRHDLDAVVHLAIAAPDDEVLAVDEALDRLAAKDPVKAELVKLRYFAGFTTAEAARLLSISVATAERYWTYARAWLHREIKRN